MEGMKAGDPRVIKIAALTTNIVQMQEQVTEVSVVTKYPIALTSENQQLFIAQKCNLRPMRPCDNVFTLEI